MDCPFCKEPMDKMYEGDEDIGDGYRCPVCKYETDDLPSRRPNDADRNSD